MPDELSPILSERCIELCERSRLLVEAAQGLRVTAEKQIADAKELIAHFPPRL